MKKIFGGLFVLLCALSLFACDFSEKEQFGYFTHNGYALESFGVESISYQDAYEIVKSSSPFVDLKSTNQEYSKSSNNDVTLYTTSFGPVLTEDEMKAMMSKYSSVTIETKYFDGNTQVIRENTVYLTSYTQDNVIYYPEILKNNQNTIATGMVINNIIMTNNLLTYYEQINQDFINAGGRVDAPFLDIYAYERTNDGLVILCTSDYSSNNSSITGTNTMEIHQTQAIYVNNLISSYQASFGFSYATPGDTTYVGTVLEVSFTWNEMK